MRSQGRNKKKSIRLRRDQGTEGSLGMSLTDPKFLESKDQPVSILWFNRESKDRRLGGTFQSSDQEPKSELDNLLQEDNIMSQLRYKRFKGDRSQDVDDWLSEFESTVLANQENGVA